MYKVCDNCPVNLRPSNEVVTTCHMSIFLFCVTMDVLKENTVISTVNDRCDSIVQNTFQVLAQVDVLPKQWHRRHNTDQWMIFIFNLWPCTDIMFLFGCQWQPQFLSNHTTQHLVLWKPKSSAWNALAPKLDPFSHCDWLIELTDVAPLAYGPISNRMEAGPIP